MIFFFTIFKFSGISMCTFCGPAFNTSTLSATLSLRSAAHSPSFICPDHVSKAHCDFFTLFCNTDPNYTPQTNRERLHLKPNTSSLSVWHLVFVPMHLNYILTIPACIRRQRKGECVHESVTCLTSLHQANSRLKQKKEPAESHRTSCSLIV